MSISEFQMFQDQERSNWVRLRTLVTLRWFAALGQAVAAIVAANLYKLEFQYGMVGLVIASAVLANLL